MGSINRTSAAAVAHLWRTLITAAYIVGVLVWCASDAPPRAVPLSVCVYGRCPSPTAPRAGVHPTTSNIGALGVAAVLAGWAVPVLLQDGEEKAKGPRDA